MPVLARAFLLLAFTVLVIGSVVVGIAARRVRRTYDLPPPPIVRATAPVEIARGKRLFLTNCLDCHAEPDGNGTSSASGSARVIATRTRVRRPVGARVIGAPEFLGEIWAPNLTRDPETGLGSWSDGEIARLLRNGIRKDGHYAGSMPRFSRLADQDVAALIGFLRSDDPLIAPVPNQVPRSGLGLAGTLALAFAAGVDTRGEAHVPLPPREPTVDYGRYLAAAVYGCVDCHTDGFKTTDENLRSAVLLAGGLFLRTPRGEPIYSSNLTPDRQTGIGTWTAGDLARALATGLGPTGLPLRPPMPVFRYVDAVESDALFAYLRSVPAIGRKTPGPPREHPSPDAPAAHLFEMLGCAICHAEGAPHHSRLKNAATRTIPEITVAIRHPEASYPGTQMPTYAEAFDHATATRLAAWIQSTGGSGRP
jgi:mono/diheme cytochrome c family protein